MQTPELIPIRNDEERQWLIKARENLHIRAGELRICDQLQRIAGYDETLTLRHRITGLCCNESGDSGTVDYWLERHGLVERLDPAVARRCRIEWLDKSIQAYDDENGVACEAFGGEYREAQQEVHEARARWIDFRDRMPEGTPRRVIVGGWTRTLGKNDNWQVIIMHFDELKPLRQQVASLEAIGWTHWLENEPEPPAREKE